MTNCKFLLGFSIIAIVVLPGVCHAGLTQKSKTSAKGVLYCEEAKAAVLTVVSLVGRETKSAKPFMAARAALRLADKAKRKGNSSCIVEIVRPDLMVIQYVYYFLHRKYIRGHQPGEDFGKAKQYSFKAIRKSLKSLPGGWNHRAFGNAVNQLREAMDFAEEKSDRKERDRELSFRASLVTGAFGKARNARLRVRHFLDNQSYAEMKGSGYLFTALTSKED